MPVRKPFPQHRHRRRVRRFHFTDHAAEIEAQFGIEFARELLHTLVVGEAAHVQELDAAIARGKQSPVKQSRTDAMALPGLLDAEGDLGLVRWRGSNRTQLGGPAQDAVNEEPVNDSVEAADRADVVGDEFFRHGTTEPAAPAVLVEPQKMLTVFFDFADPDLPDDAAVDEQITHFGSPDVCSSRNPLGPPPAANPGGPYPVPT